MKGCPPYMEVGKGYMQFDFAGLDKKRQEIYTSRKQTESLLADKGIVVESDSAEFCTEATSLKELRIAAIMDEFTLCCYQPECTLLEVSPEHFEQELDAFLPDMLFVESAWNGNHGLWKDKLAHGSREYFSLARYCTNKNIPIIFWNKEDPFHFDDFLLIAKSADYIFTTDSDMIPAYQSHIGFDRVYHLHFAAQPRLHNPLEIGTRQDKFCFAGAYYRCYPKRVDVFERFAQIFISTKGLAIYDREYGKKRSAYKFPAKYKPYILGTLKADEIEKAHKGYVFGINMNTVVSSSTMFSRRVFELMASNTVTVGNYARGLDNYFGQRTVCTDDAKMLAAKLEKYCSTEADIHKYRLLGLREILTSHLYEDRLNEIASKVYGINLKKELPCITVVAQVQNPKEAQWILAEYKAQTYMKKRLLIFFGDELITEGFDQSNPSDIAQKRFETLGESGYVACFNPLDYYACNYLYDMVYSLRYCEAPIVGKDAYYSMHSGSLQYHSGHLYCYGDGIAVRRAIIDVALIEHMSIKEFLALRDLPGRALYIDEWNYCENTLFTRQPAVEDMELL